MQKILAENSKFILRFDRGEDVIEKLKGFCAENQIGSGYFSVIGAVKGLILSFYDLEKKEFIDKEYDDYLEIASFTGNIAVKDSEVVVHSHGVFSDRELKTIGGHVKKMIVSATCELVLEKFEQKTEREYDEETGLNLLK